MIKRHMLLIIIAIDAIILLTQTLEISISYSEASLVYGDFSFLQFFVKSSIYLFGQNDFALRLPMIITHLLSVALLYEISKQYVSKETDRLWLILLFILLPGVISAALLVNSAGLVIFGLFLFLYLQEKFSNIGTNLLLFSYLFVDQGFAYLFLGLSVYHLYSKQKYGAFYNMALFLSSVYMYGSRTFGVPKGHFLDTIGIYSTIFTPIIFVFIFYTLYRRLLAQKRDMIWYLAATSLILSLLLSFRQRVAVEDFAPYLLIALPLMAQTFIHSYRVRLKPFRKRYRLLFILTFVFLIFNYLVVIFNKELYLILENPKKHFAYDSHIAKKIAQQLKDKNITCVATNKKMSLRLQFYEINSCDEYVLADNDLDLNNNADVTISYKNKIIYSANVTKLNIK